MGHIKRTERLAVITRMLSDSPNRIHNYNEFCTLFDVAKSSVSEDMDILAECFRENGFGVIETITGAAGGVRYRPVIRKEDALKSIKDVCTILSEPGRLLAGGYLFSSDVAGDPEITTTLGNIIAGKYYENMPDFVLTMETKGIPLAMMTAKALGVGLVVARRDSKAYEGSAVKINYVSGLSNERVETMALPKRSVRAGQKALIVDDFVKGGGTLQGMVEMMKECQVEVVGVEVMIATAIPENKLCTNYHSLMMLTGQDKMKGSCTVVPGKEYV